MRAASTRVHCRTKKKKKNKSALEVEGGGISRSSFAMQKFFYEYYSDKKKYLGYIKFLKEMHIKFLKEM